MNHVKAIFLIPLALTLIIIGNILSSKLIFWIAPTGKIFFEKLFLGMVSILPLLGITVLLGFYIQRQLIKWSTRWAGLGLLLCLGLFIIYFLFIMMTMGEGRIYECIIDILLLLGTIYGVYGTWKDYEAVDQ
jgi:hypothetical protein